MALDLESNRKAKKKRLGRERVKHREKKDGTKRGGGEKEGRTIEGNNGSLEISREERWLQQGNPRSRLITMALVVVLGCVGGGGGGDGNNEA